MLEPVRSLTTLFDQPVPLPPAAYHLLIMGPELFLAQALPPRGMLTIGRAENADVRLDDPLASRLHARLHIGAGCRDRGPRQRQQDARARRRARARRAGRHAPGEAVAIGSTILMVQQRAAAAVRVCAAQLHGGAPRGGVRALRGDARSVRARAAARPSAVAPGRSPSCRAGAAPADMLALYGPNEYEICWRARRPSGRDDGAGARRRARARGRHRAHGLATYPRDGRTPEALVAAASSARARRSRRQRRPRRRPSSTIAGMERVYAAGRARRGRHDQRPHRRRDRRRQGGAAPSAMHRLSPRAERRRSVPQLRRALRDLLESELFGHERGAFTGATEAKPGLLETAHGGTVFLDEIGEMPLALQAKLLRVLEDARGACASAASSRAPIDVRFIAATNRDLEDEVAAGRFRRDLYFRLNGMTLHIPPLRARRGEIAARWRGRSSPSSRARWATSRRRKSLRRRRACSRPTLARERARAAQHDGARRAAVQGRRDPARAPAIETMAANALSSRARPRRRPSRRRCRPRAARGIGAPDGPAGRGEDEGAHPARARRVRRQPEPRREGPGHRAQHAGRSA